MSTSPEPIYDEAAVPAYHLPPLLTHADGRTVTAPSWPQRREELLAQFRDEVFGHAPTTGWTLTIDGIERWAVGAIAERVQVAARIATARGVLPFSLLITRPLLVDGPVPALLGCNFAGNHTTTADPRVALTSAWVPDRSAEGVTGPTASTAGRGCLARRWPVLEAVAQGIAVATVYSGEFDPDRDDGFADGVHGLFGDPADRDQHSWGTIAAWAWGLSRCLDVISENVPEIDPRRVVSIGHSRMGKTALWAAAQDERLAGAVANGSGCTGAALSRRRIGERLVHINQRFPHWFARAYHAYAEREHELPIDQHLLQALVAPRPLYVASASNDHWADPRGEHAGSVAASPAWQLHGLGGVPEAWPAENQSVGAHLGYHCRPGAHDLLAVDWQHVLTWLARCGV